ncbi:pantoate--beta-alanine ligase [Haoranjiania flava]|uniref:Pantothenate synthetase n=1 Tax=Haoranjiania flava TaxID=1856322 RepID=A0AAE3IRH0_9BACT|nr:pantoate--beta-alanine ligase [Haoranjiania flava]MCU7695056.1 pantoate--beta-alanine ligase [Haoranjiania flava]
MVSITKIEDVQKVLNSLRVNDKKTGFVPTMGALHPGHISLISKSVERGDNTVCSIFVNPTQFNDSADFEKYPRTLENDLALLAKNGCNVVFMPSVEEMYPGGSTLREHYDLGFIETILEGRFRPGHFQGVCQVVERLLRIVQPDELFLGQKDLQQILVIKKMIELKNIQTDVIICETLREPSGLASSSRNARLSEMQKEQAAIIYRMLQYCRENLYNRSLEELSAYAQQHILGNGFDKIDYFSFHNAATLAPVELWDGEEKLSALFAGYIGGVRLIDNMFMN